MEKEKTMVGLKIFEDFIGSDYSKDTEECLYIYSEDIKHKYMTQLKYIFEIINPEICIQ